MEWMILLAPVVVPVGALYLMRRWGGRSIWLQLAVAGIVSSALGGFLAAAASAMATSVRPETAVLRGAGIGFVFGVSVGILYLIIVKLWQRLVQRVD